MMTRRFFSVALLALSLIVLMPSGPILAQDPQSSALEPVKSVEERRILVTLQEERDKLASREKDLDHREMELKTLQAEVDKKLDELKTLRQQYEKLLAERDSKEAERVAELSQMYEKMDPAKAAAIVSSLDDNLAIGILSGMKKKSAGKLLNNMDPQKAVRLSRKFSSIEPN